MKKQYPYLIDLIDLIYEKYHNLLPFLNLLRKDVDKFEFAHLGEDRTALITLGNSKISILINIDFVEEYKLNNEDILWLLCHELSHYILQHLSSKYNGKYSPQFRNIGFDCQVNSMLYNINERKTIDLLVKANWVNYTDFLNGDAYDFYFLLVPPIDSEESVRNDFANLDYDSDKLNLIVYFWFNNYSSKGLGLDEIFYYLEQIIPQEEEEVDEDNLIDENEIPFNLSELPENIQATWDTIQENLIAEKFEVKIEQISESLIERDFNLDKVDLQIRKQNILKNAMKESFFMKSGNGVGSLDAIQQSSIFPNITRKEASIISSGYLPTFYNNTLDVETKSNIAIYIDFSISTQDYHAEICKLLTSLKSINHGKYFAFSTSVEEITFDDLLTGRFESSGTDINPVVNHINENHFKKVLIITDGDFESPISTTRSDLFILLFEESNKYTVLKEIGSIKKIWYL